MGARHRGLRLIRRRTTTTPANSSPENPTWKMVARDRRAGGEQVRCEYRRRLRVEQAHPAFLRLGEGTSHSSNAPSDSDELTCVDRLCELAGRDRAVGISQARRPRNCLKLAEALEINAPSVTTRPPTCCWSRGEQHGDARSPRARRRRALGKAFMSSRGLPAALACALPLHLSRHPAIAPTRRVAAGDHRA